MIDDKYINIYNRFLNLCENDNGSPENDYKSIYIYKDGNNGRKQVTLGKGFTQDGGNLWKVLAEYIANGGANAKFFAGYKTKMSSSTLWTDQKFITTLRDSSKESAMRMAQDKVFKTAYLDPAFNWADKNGFIEPLSYGVVADSYLHSGRMTPSLISKFTEKTPANGGNERVWIKAYLSKRLAWFERSTGLLRTCTFRPRFFLNQIAKNNWQLACPLVVPNKGTIC